MRRRLGSKNNYLLISLTLATRTNAPLFLPRGSEIKVNAFCYHWPNKITCVGFMFFNLKITGFFFSIHVLICLSVYKSQYSHIKHFK